MAPAPFNVVIIVMVINNAIAVVMLTINEEKPSCVIFPLLFAAVRSAFLVDLCRGPVDVELGARVMDPSPDKGSVPVRTVIIEQVCFQWLTMA